MRKMMKAIAAVLAVSALMAGSAFAADKLIVKDSGGTNNVFSVKDTIAGDVTIADFYNSGVRKVNLRSVGIMEWYLGGNGGAEVGAIKYSTPGGGVGIGFTTGPAYDQNQFNIANYPTLGTGSNAVAGIGYTTGTAMVTLDKTSGNVGIGTLYGANVPTAKLDVDGNAIRIRTSQSPASNAACSAGAMAWDASYIYVCTASGAWKRAALTGGY